MRDESVSGRDDIQPLNSGLEGTSDISQLIRAVNAHSELMGSSSRCDHSSSQILMDSSSALHQRLDGSTRRKHATDSEALSPMMEETNDATSTALNTKRRGLR